MEPNTAAKSEWRTPLLITLGVYLIAFVYLIAIGEVTNSLLRVAMVAFELFLLWLTFRVTRPVVTIEPAALSSKPRLWAQIGVLTVVIVITGLQFMDIPLWSNMVSWFRHLGESFLPGEWFGGPGNALANPVQYFVIPFILLLLLGAKPKELGFGKGNKVWQAVLVWLTLPLLFMGGLVVSGSLPLQAVARRFISNFFQNGFFEEFIFRGALQTRLLRFKALAGMLVLQAFAFGFWHLQANTDMMNGNVLAGLALCVTAQTIPGLVFGLIYQRTRNLVAPSAAHVAMNVVAQSF